MHQPLRHQGLARAWAPRAVRFDLRLFELGMGSSRFELRVSALAGRVLWPLLFGLIALALAPFWSAARAFMRPCGAPKAVLLAPFWAVKWTRHAWSARILRLAVVLFSLRLAESVCFDVLC